MSKEIPAFGSEEWYLAAFERYAAAMGLGEVEVFEANEVLDYPDGDSAAMELTLCATCHHEPGAISLVQDDAGVDMLAFRCACECHAA